MKRKLILMWCLIGVTLSLVACNGKSEIPKDYKDVTDNVNTEETKDNLGL